VHGVAWTSNTGMVDLGTLADTHDPRYATYTTSYAIGTNKLGTLIVGGSGPGGNIYDGFLAPVVWTPSMKWEKGKFVTKWKIHKLDTAAFPDFGWVVWGVNDHGQILGVGGNGNPATKVVGALWNQLPDGKGWGKLIPLAPSSTYPLTEPYGINEKGEIVGIVASDDWSIWRPTLWKPLDRKRTTYSQVIMLPLPPGGFTNGEGVGINDLGDMVGDCWNDDGSVDLAVRWTTKDPTFSEVLDFPAVFSFAWGVNDFGIASVTYLSDLGGNCSWDTYGSCGGAIKLH